MRSTLPTFNEVWQQQFEQHLRLKIAEFSAQQKIVLGCSGGVDSILLLHLFASIAPERLHVITIDHQLQQPSARWSQQVASLCQDYQVACDIVTVQVGEGNTEAAARAARYSAFEKILRDGDVLVLGHHQQDQAETVLLRLLQGSGVGGLAAMAEQESRSFVKGAYLIWRPMLNLAREDIEAWANTLKLPYIQDPMNDDIHYDRVWCRKQLWPLLKQRFHKMQQGICRSAVLMQDADEILKEVLESDFKACITAKHQLDLNALNQISQARQRQLLSAWMQGEQLYRPPLAMIERLKKEVIHAKEDATSQLHFGQYYFVRFAEHLYRFSESEWHNFRQHPLSRTFIPMLDQSYTLTVGQINIVAVHQDEIGLAKSLLGKQLLLVPRQGGERVHLLGRVGHRPLKKLLQDAKIAPWERHQTQILMYHNDIIGVLTTQGFWLVEQPFLEKGGWLPRILI